MIKPSDLLIAAADRVRDLAAQATPGQWETIKRFDKRDNHVMSSFIRPPMDPKGCVQDRNIRPHEHADYAWVAALSPEVAPHLEAVLRDRAEVIRWAKSWDEVADIPERHLAESILGVGLAGETP